MTSVHLSESLEDLHQQTIASLAHFIAVAPRRFTPILVRCNYQALQRRAAAALRSACPVPIQEIDLPPNPENLWQPIINGAGSQRHRALMVVGWENVANPVALLRDLETHQAELDRRCPWPVMIWLTENGYAQLAQQAPRFYNTAGFTVTLESSTADLNLLWREVSDQLFAEIVARGLDQFTDNYQSGFGDRSRLRQELQAATRDLRDRDATPLALTATWHLLLGRDCYAQGDIGKALVNYQKSLNCWERLREQRAASELTSFTHDTLQIRWALVKLHMAYCYYQQAQLAGQVGQTSWQLARDTLLTVGRVLEQQQRFDLTMQVLTLTGDTLRALGNWLELENIAQGILGRPEMQESSLNLAQAYGFLAEVALHQNQFELAATQARYALELTQAVADPAQSAIGHGNLARYLLQVAKAEAREARQARGGLSDFAPALDRLQQAQQLVTPQSHGQLYLDILQELRLLYHHTGQYWEALQTKQQQQLIRYQRGLTAFVGMVATNDQARVLAATGREQDVRWILDYLNQAHQPLLVIHGDSGIGKTSLLQGGLIPALGDGLLHQRSVVVAYQNNYHNWPAVLTEALHQATGRGAIPGAAEVEQVRQHLHWNIEHDRATVLVFDQFEEFFLAVPQLAERQTFYRLLQSCLEFSYVQVCLVIRQENIHQLLECERYLDCSAFAPSLLDRSLRYPLGNFSPDRAYGVIERLTSSCRYYLEPALAERLVSDLTDEYGEVSPVQLQLVGAQLQNENVKTIAQYLQLAVNPHQYLMERALDEGIRQCGLDHQEAVLTTLFLLTDSLGQRPQRTFSQLLPATSNLQPAYAPSRRGQRPLLMAQQHNSYAQLLLLLNILVAMGLVSCSKSETENRYHLIHDELVEPIRTRYAYLRAHPLPLKVAPAAWQRWVKRGAVMGKYLWQQWSQPATWQRWRSRFEEQLKLGG